MKDQLIFVNMKWRVRWMNDDRVIFKLNRELSAIEISTSQKILYIYLYVSSLLKCDHAKFSSSDVSSEVKKKKKPQQQSVIKKTFWVRAISNEIHKFMMIVELLICARFFTEAVPSEENVKKLI